MKNDRDSVRSLYGDLEAGSLLSEDHCDTYRLTSSSQDLPWGSQYRFSVTRVGSDKVECFPKSPSSWFGYDGAVRQWEEIKETDWETCIVYYQ